MDGDVHKYDGQSENGLRTPTNRNNYACGSAYPRTHYPRVDGPRPGRYRLQAEAEAEAYRIIDRRPSTPPRHSIRDKAMYRSSPIKKKREHYIQEIGRRTPPRNHNDEFMLDVCQRRLDDIEWFLWFSGSWITEVPE